MHSLRFEVRFLFSEFQFYKPNNRMRKALLFTFIILTCTIDLNAQWFKKSYSITPTVTDLTIGNNGLVQRTIPGTTSVMLSAFGPAYCFGDPGVLSTKKFFLNVFDFNLLDTRFVYSLGLRHIFTNNFGLKATYYYGTYTGTDVGSIYPTRGYSFNSKVMEFTLNAEYILLGGPNDKYLTPHTLYVFAGAGVLHSNVIFMYNDNVITTPPPSRPNDKIQLVTTAPVIPLGIGYQYQLNYRLSIGAEFVYHSVFSDFVDGIQTQGSKNDDALTSLSFTFAYKIMQNRKKSTCNCNR